MSSPINKGIVCFMGMDGSGKSTIISEINQWLTSLGYSTKLLHTHDYNVKSLHTLNAIGQEGWIRKYHYLLVFWPFVALFDHWMTFRKKFSAADKFILTDRYFYDKYVRFRFWKIALPGLFYLYKWLLPRPLCIILLDVPTEVALERKGEYSKDDYDIFRYEYLQFASDMKIDAIIDATKSVSEVVNATKKCISSKLNLKLPALV